MPSPNRGGPVLPYSIVAGVTPCAPGWLVMSAKLNGATFAPELPRVLSSFVEVLDERPSFSVIALNAPIGWVEETRPGGRTCDRLARGLLGRRGSTVHNAPSRASLKEAAEPAIGGLDAISTALLPRYREVAAEMAPYRQRTVFEVHPELSFFQLNGDMPLRWTKKFEVGREERRALLIKRIPGIDRALECEFEDVPLAHLLDAGALLWTARRIFARAGTRLPKDPEWDDEGLRMEIVR
jgi:predicted RNase H-like nuclease